MSRQVEMRRAADRILSQTIPSPDGCLWFTGHITKDGYGQVSVKKVSTNPQLAHRVVLEASHGEAPEGLMADHVCHSRSETCPGGKTCTHRRCVNAAHLEWVTHAENCARGVKARATHCSAGHEFTPENTRERVEGGRVCKQCRRDWYHAKKAAA